jgi:hypothetical protein
MAEPVSGYIRSLESIPNGLSWVWTKVFREDVDATISRTILLEP